MVYKRLALTLFVLFLTASSPPARAEVVYLVCDGYAQYSDGQRGGIARNALIFDFNKRLVFMKEDGEGHPMTSVTESRIAWRNPDTPNRLTSSEGQFSTVTMSGREFYTIRGDGRGWTNHFENCKRTKPGITQSDKIRFMCNMNVNNKSVTYRFETYDAQSVTETMYIVNGKSETTFNNWRLSFHSDAMTLIYSNDPRYRLEITRGSATLIRNGTIIGSGRCEDA